MVIGVSKLVRLKGVRCYPVTAEPMLFCYFFSMVLSTYVGANLLLHKGCHPNATAAPDLARGLRCPQETEAQQHVAAINMAKAVVQELLSITFIMFAGPWSDRHGRRRRPLMLVPLFGQMVCDTVNLLSTVFWAGVSPVATGMAQAVIVSVTGSSHCFLIGVSAYLSDITSETDRTVRLGFAATLCPLAATAAALCSGYLNVRLGFVGVFAFNIGVNVIALALGLLFVDDASKPLPCAASGGGVSTTEPRPSTSGGGVLATIKDVLDPRMVATSFKATFAKRPDNKGIVLLLMIVAAPLTSSPFYGEYFHFAPTAPKYRFHVTQTHKRN